MKDDFGQEEIAGRQSHKAKIAHSKSKSQGMFDDEENLHTPQFTPYKKKAKPNTQPKKEQDEEQPMEFDEDSKKRLLLIESEINNIQYNDPEADGVLARDSAPLDKNPNDNRTESMRK